MRFVNLPYRDKKTRDSRKLTPNGVEEDLFNAEFMSAFASWLDYIPKFCYPNVKSCRYIAPVVKELLCALL